MAKEILMGESGPQDVSEEGWDGGGKGVRAVDYARAAALVGKLVEMKNEAYGDSFARADQILRVLYPHGVRVEQYRDMLAITRVIDKLFRIATRKDAFGESPWEDVAGYGILGMVADRREREIEEKMGVISGVRGVRRG